MCWLVTLHCKVDCKLHCTILTVHSTLYTVNCTLYTVHCKLYTAHCTLYTVNWLTGYNGVAVNTITQYYPVLLASAQEVEKKAGGSGREGKSCRNRQISYSKQRHYIILNNVYLNLTLQYFLGARGILHSILGSIQTNC